MAGVAAFFDVDGTLTNTNLVTDYYHFLLSRPRARWMVPWLLEPGGELFWLPVRTLYYWALDRYDRARFVRAFYRNYRWWQAEQVREWATGYFQNRSCRRIFPGAARRAAWHKCEGHKLVLVTGGPDFVVVPLGEHLEADAIIAAQLEEDDQGRFTGRTVGPPLVGEEKARRVREFAQERGLNLRECYAYGDHISDRAMLEAVGKPVAVNPEQRLRRLARERGWEIADWRRGGIRGYGSTQHGQQGD